MYNYLKPLAQSNQKKKKNPSEDYYGRANNSWTPKNLVFHAKLESNTLEVQRAVIK